MKKHIFFGILAAVLLCNVVVTQQPHIFTSAQLCGDGSCDSCNGNNRK